MSRAKKPLTDMATETEIAETEPTFGNSIGDAPGAGFLSAMIVASKEPAEPPKEPAVAAKAAESVKQAPVVDDEIPKDIKSGQAADAFRKIKSERDEYRKKYEDHDKQVGEMRKRLETPATPQVPEEFTQRLAAIEKERDELSDRLRVSDVEQHPKFKQYFDGKNTELISAAKAIVGAEHGDKLEKILRMADNDQRTELLDEMLGDLSPSRQSRLGAVVANIESLQRERAAEVGKSKERWGQLQQQSQAEAAGTMRQKEELAERLVNAATELEAFKADASTTPERSKQIDTYKTFVRQALTGRLEGQDAQFMPLMAVEGLHLKTAVLPGLQAKVKELEERLAEFTSANPRAGGSSASGSDGQPRSFLEVLRGTA